MSYLSAKATGAALIGFSPLASARLPHPALRPACHIPQPGAPCRVPPCVSCSDRFHRFRHVAFDSGTEICTPFLLNTSPGNDRTTCRQKVVVGAFQSWLQTSEESVYVGVSRRKAGYQADQRFIRADEVRLCFGDRPFVEFGALVLGDPGGTFLDDCKDLV